MITTTNMPTQLYDALLTGALLDPRGIQEHTSQPEPKMKPQGSISERVQSLVRRVATPRPDDTPHGDKSVTNSDPEHVTQILQGFDENPHAAEELLPIVYEQLRSIAASRMSGERRDHTLQPTALVHEAYMRLLGSDDIAWESRAHFFGAAAQAMRRILIDHARAKNSLKRGGTSKPMPLNVIDLATSDNPEHILALDEAMDTLEQEDADAARVVRLRFYAGLSVDETAQALGISPRTAAREWSFARARLYQLLTPDSDA
ncbi:MAG: sigma-70 family RNA polymerase sigma factor [Planctomycetota bacterium]|jgi:RNA polymerase sigma factor (TIGR02999 family)